MAVRARTSLTEVAIEALRAVDRAERAYVKAMKAEADKAEVDRRKEKVKEAAKKADRAFQDWRRTAALVFGPLGPKG